MRIFIILLFPTLVWAGTWRDDFEDGDLNGWEEFDLGGDGKVEEKEGELVVTDISGGFVTLAFFNKGQTLKDFILTLDAKMAKQILRKGYMWIVWRFTGAAWAFNGYDPSEPIWISVFQPPNFFGTVKVPFAFEVGKWYHIELEMKGAQLSLWVDGKLIREIDWKNQPLPESGKVGLGGGRAELHFDNFAITGDEVPDGGPGGSAVVPQDKLATTWSRVKAF
jgi:hypothetical protein